MPLDTGYGDITGAMLDKLPRLIEVLEVGLKITGPDLCDKVFGYDRGQRIDREPKHASDLRGMILHLRLKGFTIASDHKGYWLAKSFEELLPTITEYRLLAERKLKVANILAKAFEKQNQTELL